MIQSRPKLKSKRSVFQSLLLIIVCVVLFSMAPIAAKYAAIVQFAAILCAAVSVFLLIKYVIPDYLYTLEDGHLRINKITKSQSLCVADIETYTIRSQPLTASEYKKYSAEHPIKLHSFIKNPGDSDLRYLIFRFDESNQALLFEPDEHFLKELIKEIERIEKIKEKEDEND